METDNKILQPVKVGYGNDLIVSINSIEELNLTEYKVFQSQIGELFVRGMKITYNGRTQILYIPENLKSLDEIVMQKDIQEIDFIIKNVFAKILKIKENGFLMCQNLVSFTDNIYVDPITYNILYIYIPLRMPVVKNSFEFDAMLLKNIMQMIEQNPRLQNLRIARIINQLNMQSVSIENIYNQLNEAKDEVDYKTEYKVKYDAEDETDDTFIDFNKNKEITMRLVGINTPVRYEIVIDKDEYTIGRKRESVDGVIGFSKMIGRMHCKIIRRGEQFAIIDLNSANGTFINGERIQPEKIYSLRGRDIIGIANCEFKVLIG